MYKAMHSYLAKNHSTDNEHSERELVRHWKLFAANGGLRIVQQRQLGNLDVGIEGERNGTFIRRNWSTRKRTCG